MDSIRLGTAHLTDDEFVGAFESCRLPAAQFHHADHVRLAWVYLGRESEPMAAERFEQALQRFAAHNGVSEKYHRTITLAWIRLVGAARKEAPQAVGFYEFAEMHPELLAVEYLEKFYSQERLARREAREGWVAPDLLDLPG